MGDSEFARKLDRIKSSNLNDNKSNNEPIEPKDVGLEDEVIDAITLDKKDENWRSIRKFA